VTSTQLYLVHDQACFVRTKGLVVSVANDARITNSFWEEYLRQAQAVHRDGGDYAALLNLVMSMGPNAAQRRRLGEVADSVGLGKIMRHALLTESAAMRGIVTAVQWLLRSSPAELQTYKPSERGHALDWLGRVADFDRREAAECLCRAAKAVGIVLAPETAPRAFRDPKQITGSPKRDGSYSRGPSVAK